MLRSRARLAADWFAKLRLNEVTQTVEQTDVVTAITEVSNSVTLADWSLVETNGVLYISYNSVPKFKLESDGSLTALGDVTAYGVA